jgi:hypothetical protein
MTVSPFFPFMLDRRTARAYLRVDLRRGLCGLAVLLELLTFDPRGDVEARADCPPAWADLVADSMNRLKGKRPQTARDFMARLEAQKQAPPPPPPPGPQRIRELIEAERFQEAFDEYRRLPHERRQPALLKEL